MARWLNRASAIFAFVFMAAVTITAAVMVYPTLLPRTQAAEATAPVVAIPEPAPAPALDASAIRAQIDRSGRPLQCAIYARQRTGIALTGAARNWWPQAEGRYQRAHTPEAGAVIVLGGTSAGHVAVVTRVLSPTQIVVDHANWLGGGEIITGALVEDASSAGDWSAVRVWNVETDSMGMRAYPVFGFVLPNPA